MMEQLKHQLSDKRASGPVKLTLDVENTVTKRNGKLHLDPFEPDNTLVMVGMLDDRGNETIVTFDHSEVSPTSDGHKIVQDALDKATVLIGHNISHDLVWLWESGFKYNDGIHYTTWYQTTIIS